MSSGTVVRRKGRPLIYLLLRCFVIFGILCCASTNECANNNQCNGGTCADNTCTCADGWTGYKCVDPVVVDVCSPDPCTAPEVCTPDGSGSYTCTIDVCSPDPCTTPEVCTPDGSGSYTCTNVCLPDPCTTPEVCTPDGSGSYTCTNVCSPDPCTAPEVCTPDGSGSYTCTNVCLPDPCTAPEVCTPDGSGSYTCPNVCLPDPCTTPEVCTPDGSGSYTCTNVCLPDPCTTPEVCTPDGSGGHTCTNPCDLDPCQPFEACTATAGGHSCTGPCDSDPCETYEECIVSGTSYVCKCPPNKAGPTCGVTISVCSNDCGSHGRCVEDDIGGTGCQCDIGWAGEVCDIDETANLACPKPLGVAWSVTEPLKFGMSASNAVNEYNLAEHGRLGNPTAAWCASPDQVEPHLIIDLHVTHVIYGMVVRGDPQGNNYVSSFVVMSKASPEYDDFIDHGTFGGFPTPFGYNIMIESAYQVKIIVKAKVGQYPCMQVELHGCPFETKSVESCFSTIGLADPDVVPDDKFTTDSTHDPYQSKFGRLNGASAWCPSVHDKHLRVFVPRLHKKVVGILLQGLHDPTEPAIYEYTTKFHVKDKTDNVHSYGEGHKDMYGNINSYGVVGHFFDTASDSLYDNDETEWEVKVKEKKMNYACVRVDYIGCDGVENPCNSYPCKHGGTCERRDKLTYRCNCATGFQGSLCETSECFQIINYKIESATRSSQVDDPPLAGNGDLRLDQFISWCALASDASPFVEIQLISIVSLTGVTMGGHHDPAHDSIVERFTIDYKLRTTSAYTRIMNGANDFFPGVTKSGLDKVQHIWMDNPVIVYILRFELFGTDDKKKCFRINLHGCEVEFTKKTELCFNDGAYRSGKPFTCNCKPGYVGYQCETQVMISSYNCVPSLGVADSNRVSNSMLSANRYMTGREGSSARLNNQDSAWCVEYGDYSRLNTRITVQFSTISYVFAVATQGSNVDNAWVEEYYISTSNNGHRGPLVGNNDSNTVVTALTPGGLPIANINIKYTPLAAEPPAAKLCARLEFYGINDESLSQYLLADSSTVTDSMMTASHEEPGFESFNARLQNSAGAWCAPNDALNPYLQIDFPKEMLVSIIVTRGHPLHEAYVYNYRVSTTLDRNTWDPLTINGDEVFSGNWNIHDYHLHMLPVPVNSAAIRFYPDSYRNQRCLRVDVFACNSGAVANPCDNCHANATCIVGADGVSSCVCNADLIGDGEDMCVDCASIGCHPNATCSFDEVNNYANCACKPSFVGNGYNCTDMCEFALCHADATCRFNETGNSTSCTCNPGFLGDGYNCTDMCEFALCHADAKCRFNETVNSTSCTCNPGFLGDGYNCTDMCEFVLCHADAKCRFNETGNSTSCTCDPGFLGDGYNCTDICTTVVCHDNATCSFNKGSNSHCTCNPGFTGDGYTCTDLCTVNVCHASATCDIVETVGECVCNPGFFGNGENCAACSFYGCHDSATCYVDSSGGHCTCGFGFTGDGFTCTDLCELTNCHPNATCHVDDSGNTSCSCDSSYTGDGQNCTHLCDLAACDPNAECSVVNGSSNCTCGNGFHGNGTYCSAFYSWGAWTACSESCGNGTTMRSRTCVDPNSPHCTSDIGEVKTCFEKHCPVDGNWSAWQSSTECSVTCGSGTLTMERTCTNPAPAHHGQQCSGLATEPRACDVAEICPGEAGFGQWSEWGDCNETCGDGYKTRIRTCKDISLGCDGSDTQDIACFLVHCQVDGGFTEWDNWSECLPSCGPGSKMRTRNCTNPEPAHGGQDCVGETEETEGCSLKPLCDGDMGYGDWSSWSECSTACGPGTHSRSRECSLTDPGESFCTGPNQQSGECEVTPCPIDGAFTDWLDWETCSLSCGFEQVSRTRACSNPEPQFGGLECYGEDREIEDCDLPVCPESMNYSPWSGWSECSVSCGTGTQSRTRECLNATGYLCDGPDVGQKECLLPKCPVHGDFTEWTPWTACPVTCGSSFIHRSRECTNPLPAYDGNDCFGPTEETDLCSMPDICPPDVDFTLWSTWSLCSVSCATGMVSRERECTEPSSDLCEGPNKMNMSCYAGECPIHGGYSNWDNWTSCSGTCGSGVKTRSRSCTNPVPAFAGSGCAGPNEENEDCQHPTECSGESGYEPWSPWSLCIQTCGTCTQLRTRVCQNGTDPQECTAAANQTKSSDKGQCPVHGEWCAWSGWGECSASCNSGAKRRTRTCTNPVPSFGGLPCYGDSDDYIVCVMPVSCTADSEFSDWGTWSECSTTCDDGIRTRSRHCTVVPTYPPSEEESCTEDTEQTIECNLQSCAIDGNFTIWTGWTACTATCDTGTRTRYRNCTNPPPLFDGEDCLGSLYEVMECSASTPCLGDELCSPWTPWEQCSATCEGIAVKTREDLDPEDGHCSPMNATMDCNTELCPVDGAWSTWTEWSLCAKTCGHQEEVRSRECTNPTPRNGGAACTGHKLEIMPCNEYDYIPCPDPPPAQWTDWSWWKVCSKSCAGGNQSRFRLCDNPPPAPGYPGCESEGYQERDCNTHFCPIHGNFTEWTDWWECTMPCGGGTQIRSRLCSNPAPEHGGDDCQGDRNQLRVCNTHHCPVHGGFTDWTDWTFCSKPCDSGISWRKRSCTNPEPLHGGDDCDGDPYQSVVCNDNVCPPVILRASITFTDIDFTDYQLQQEQFKIDFQALIYLAYDSAGQQPLIAFPSCTADSNGKTQCEVDFRFNSVSEDEIVILQDKLLENSSHTDINSITSEIIFDSQLTITSTASQSSTTIDVEWSALDPAEETAETSTLSGYTIFYKPTAGDQYKSVTVLPSQLTTTPESLLKFTPYRVVVSPSSANGNGVPSLPAVETTLEDVPSVAPNVTSLEAVSSSEISLSWIEVDPQYHHGIHQGYCVHYHAAGSQTTELLEFTTAEFSTTLTNLHSYTRYFIQVSAKTTPGCGKAAETDIYTLEEAPTGPPMNVQAQNDSSSSILVTWDGVEPEHQKGKILGYRVTYTVDGVTNTVDVPDGDADRVLLTGLKYMTEYDITVTAYNSMGSGPESPTVSATTDESTPSEAPFLTKAQNTSSTSIILKWDSIPSEHHQGVFIGYRICYRPSSTGRKVKCIDVNENTLEYELTDIFLWWWYEIQVAGLTRIGAGVPANVTVQTDESLPSRCPENIRGIALSPTTMSVEWDQVLPGFLHGLLRGYHLEMRETDDLNNLVIDTTVDAYERSYYLENLKKYTNYTIWVEAINTKGIGFRCVGKISPTGEDGPEFPPDNIRTSTMTSVSEIAVEWVRIPPEYHNGILRGYYIEYTAVVLAGEVIPSSERVTQSARIRGNRYAHVLRDLFPASTYEIVMFGYTVKNGSKSNATIAKTCACPEFISANWYPEEPYEAIFTSILRKFIKDMCPPCTNSYGETELCHTGSCQNDKRRRKRAYRKNSPYEVTSNIGRNYEISYPVQGNKYITTYAGVFPYISVVDAPGSAYFTVKNVPSTSEVVVTTSLNCVPVIILMALFASISGVIIWFLERKDNPEHFPDPFSKGAPEGFWWAFISMTTVGYGDRSPITVPGRLFAILWILMGLVIISIVTGGIVTSITSVLAVQEDRLYGAKVGTVKDSAEYRKSIRQNADVVSYDTMDDVINALANKDVAGALLDMYAAATRKDLLMSGGDIQMNRMINYPTGYGFVLSGEMLKSTALFNDFLKKRKSEVTQVIEDNTEAISMDRDKASEAKEMSSGLFDASSPAFTNSFAATTSMLAVAVIIGLIYHYRVFRKKEKMKEAIMAAMRERDGSVRVAEYLKSDGRAELEEFTQDLQEQIERLKKKHVRERKKTWRYNAEKAKRRGGRLPVLPAVGYFNKSATRVSPEVNEGLEPDVDGNDVTVTPRTPPSVRQSSLSVFNEFRRARSARVQPSPDGLAPLDRGSATSCDGSSIEMRDVNQDRN